ncbi:hypothetical protein PCE1_001540 [Barthelona sp. PCE]
MPRYKPFEEQLMIKSAMDGEIRLKPSLKLLRNRGEEIPIHMTDTHFIADVEPGVVRRVTQRRRLHHRNQDNTHYWIKCTRSKQGLISDFTVHLFPNANGECMHQSTHTLPENLDVFTNVLMLDQHHVIYSAYVGDNDQTNTYIQSLLMDNRIRCLENYSLRQLSKADFILLVREFHDEIFCIYKYSPDDLNEDIECEMCVLNDVGDFRNYVVCMNARCVCFINFGNGIFTNFIIFDEHGNRIDIIQRFPAFTRVKPMHILQLIIFKLTDNSLSIMIGNLKHVMTVSIDGSNEPCITVGCLNCYNMCAEVKHDINLSVDFIDDPNLYGSNIINNSVGVIHCFDRSNRIIDLLFVYPRFNYMGNIVQMKEHTDSKNYIFYFKENTIVVFNSIGHAFCTSQSAYSRFYCVTRLHPKKNCLTAFTKLNSFKHAKLCWNNLEDMQESHHISYNYHKQWIFGDFILNVRDNNLCINETVLIPMENGMYNSCEEGQMNTLAVNFLTGTYFFMLINEQQVEVKKQLYLQNVFAHLCPWFMDDGIQLIVVLTGKFINAVHYIDWSNTTISDPIVFENSEEYIFQRFISDSSIRTLNGIMDFYLEDGIQMRYKEKTSYPIKGKYNINCDNGVQETVKYNRNTRIMKFSTHFLQRDTLNTVVSECSYHIPSFIAGAQIKYLDTPNWNENTLLLET